MMTKMDSEAVMELHEYQYSTFSEGIESGTNIREESFDQTDQENRTLNESSNSNTEETKLLKTVSSSENQAELDSSLNSPEKKQNEIFFQNRDKFDTPVLESRPPNHMWLAICTTIFFNPLLGIVALVLSMQADTEYLQDEIDKARRLGQVVKYISLFGMLTTLIILIIISAVFS